MQLKQTRKKKKKMKVAAAANFKFHFLKEMKEMFSCEVPPLEKRPIKLQTLKMGIFETNGNLSAVESKYIFAGKLWQTFFGPLAVPTKPSFATSLYRRLNLGGFCSAGCKASSWRPTPLDVHALSRSGSCQNLNAGNRS